MELSITKSENLKTKPDDASLGFGTLFTDHMLNMDYSLDNGWHAARIEPYGSIEMDPATMFLHYGQGVFEGLKATGRNPARSSCSGPRRISNASIAPAAGFASPKLTRILRWKP